MNKEPKAGVSLRGWPEPLAFFSLGIWTIRWRTRKTYAGLAVWMAQASSELGIKRSEGCVWVGQVVCHERHTRRGHTEIRDECLCGQRCHLSIPVKENDVTSEKVERLLLFLINKTRKTKTSPFANEEARKHKSNKCYNIGDIKQSWHQTQMG